MATGGDDGDTEVDAVLDASLDVQNETKHYDVALLFAENDKNQALEILKQMEEITLENGGKPKVCLYTDLPGASSHIETGRNLTKVATLILVVATENLQDEEVAKLIKDEAIGNTRLASKCHPGLKYCVRPLYLDKESKAHPPVGLATVRGFEWYDKDDNSGGERDIRILLQNHILFRKQREREDSRQGRTVRDTSGSRPPKDSTDNINFAVSTEPAHQQRQVLERDNPPERTNLESSAAVRLPPISHREQETMATPVPEVGQQSFDSITLQTNGSSVLSRSTNEFSGARAPGQSASERNNHQTPDSTMAQRNYNAAHFMYPAQRPDLSRESYPSQDEASNILDSSPSMDTSDSICPEDADSQRNHELQISGSREEQGSGTRNTFQGSRCETDKGSIVESDLTQTNLTTDTLNAGRPDRDSQHTTDVIYTRNTSSYSEPAENVVSTNRSGKDTDFTQTRESLLVGGNCKRLKGPPLDTGDGTGSLVEGIEHLTMTEKVLKQTGQAHRPTATCAAGNDLDFGGGEKEPYGVAVPRVVHYHTHYHGEVSGPSQRGPPQRGLPGAPRYPGHPAAPPAQNPQQGGPVNMSQQAPINIVNCQNIQFGSDNKMIIGGQRERMTERDNEVPYGSLTSAAPNREDSPPPYSPPPYNPSSPSSTYRKTPFTHASMIPSQTEPRGGNPVCGGQEAVITDVSHPGSKSFENASVLTQDGPRSCSPSERLASERGHVQTGITDLQPRLESASGFTDVSLYVSGSPSDYLETAQSSEGRDRPLTDERKTK